MSHIRHHTEGIYLELLRYRMGRSLFIIIIIRMECVNMFITIIIIFLLPS
jgi:hypothetical protein